MKYNLFVCINYFFNNIFLAVFQSQPLNNPEFKFESQFQEVKTM